MANVLLVAIGLLALTSVVWLVNRILAWRRYWWIAEIVGQEQKRRPVSEATKTNLRRG